MSRYRSKREQEWRGRNMHWYLPLSIAWMIIGLMFAAAVWESIDWTTGEFQTRLPIWLVWAWNAVGWPVLIWTEWKSRRLLKQEEQEARVEQRGDVG